MDMIKIHLMIFLAIIMVTAVLWSIKQLTEKKDMNKNFWKGIFTGVMVLLVAILFLYCIPVLIACFVFYPNWEHLNKIPGTGEQWFSFWASYSGAAATVIIALFTFINSKSIDEQEKRFLRLFTGNNLRVSKVSISQYKPVDGEEETCSYRVGLKFMNLSYSMIKDIEVQGFYIRIWGKSGTNSDSLEDYKKIANGVGGCSYLLQGDIPYLTFDLTFRKGSEEEIKFTTFYYYGFYTDDNKLDIKIEIKPCLYEVKKQENITLKLTLLMTSQREEEWGELLYSTDREFILPISKVLTYRYSLQDEEEKLMEKRNKKRKKKEDRQRNSFWNRTFTSR